MQPFEGLADLVYENLHEQSNLDDTDKKYIKAVIDNAIYFVINRIQKRACDDDDVERDINEVAANTATFLAIVIAQLEFFSKGENDGPFFDMIRDILDNETQNNNLGRRPPKE